MNLSFILSPIEGGSNSVVAYQPEKSANFDKKTTPEAGGENINQ
jgi:hypothetical protein